MKEKSNSNYLRLALLTFALGLLLTACQGNDPRLSPKPPGERVMSSETVALVLASTPPAKDIFSDQIDFFHERLERNGGKDPVARAKLREGYLNRFLIYRRPDDLEQAHHQAAAVITEEPQLAAHRSAIAEIYLQAGLTRRAGVIVDSLLNNRAMGESALGELLFDIYYARGEVDKGLFALMKGTNARAPGLLMRRALFLADKNDLAGALTMMRKAAEEATDDSGGRIEQAMALSGAGDLAWRKGDALAATTFYLRALARAPAFAPAITALGYVALCEDRDIDTARKIFSQSLEIGSDPTAMLALIDLEKVAANTAAEERAIWRMDSTMNAIPLTAARYAPLLAGVLSERQADRKRIAPLLSKISLQHADPELKTSILTALIHNGEKDRAAQILKSELESTIADRRISYLAGKLLVSNKPASAQSHFARALNGGGPFYESWRRELLSKYPDLAKTE